MDEQDREHVPDQVAAMLARSRALCAGAVDRWRELGGELERGPPVQKSMTEVVHKVREQTSPAPAATPRIGEQCCSEEWNDWVRTHIAHALDIYDDSLTRVFMKVRDTERALEPLKQEIAELRGRLDVVVAMLGGTKAADVVELAADRRRRHGG
jgi:hypothetical protein